MKKLSGALAMLLISSGVNAAQLVTFDGAFISGTGSIAANQLFSGEFTIDITAPESVNYDSPSHNPPYTRIELGYWNTPISVAINGGQPIVDNSDSLYVNIEDNSELVTQPTIDLHGFTGAIQPDTYDFVSVSFDGPNAQFNQTGLYNGTAFSLIALFNKDTFTLSSLQSQGYQGLFNLNPIFLGFETKKATNGVLDFQGAGTIDNFKVTEVASVPLPGAAWLFGSALAGLALRLRKQA
ncbi:MAG: VPLPA-CTERM sorting domain-containing protein [Methylobacter sp.]|nr:VPLPA-CTERM sorting domain-containing protein [Methylobacter sp.]